MDILLRDLRHSLRQLRMHSGFAALIIATMALAIGPNTALFSVVDGILLRPLHYDDPDHLLTVWNRLPGIPPLEASFSKPEMVDIRSQSHSFEQVAAFGYGSSNVIGEDGATILWTAWISSNFLSLVGVQPALGRGFAPGDHLQDNKVALVSHDVWQNRFGGARDVVGQTLRIDADLYTVIGVMPPVFQLPLDFQWGGKTPLILPLLDPKPTDKREVRFIHVLARLRPGASLERAQTELDTLAARFRNGYPGVYPTGGDWRLEAQPVHEVVVGKVRPALLLLFAAVGLILVIACVNLSNLLLARALARKRESAIRLALGAGWKRLARQLFTESLVLALLGGALGLLLAHWGLKALIAATPGNLPRLDEVAIDGRVLLFSLALAVVTGVVLGLIPTLQILRPDLQGVMKQGGRNLAGGAGEQRLRRLLVVGEVALSLLLLIGAGLMVRSFLNLRQVDVGFEPRGLLEIAVRTPPETYPEDHQVKAFYAQLFERIAALPGVAHVGGANSLPFHVAAQRRPVMVEGRPPAPGEPEATAGLQVVTPGYFEALRTPLKAGRLLGASDHERSQPVAVINESFRRRLMGGADPIGLQIALPDPKEPEKELVWRSIVGVVGDIRYSGLDVEAGPEVYLPHRQQDFGATNQGRGLFVMVRASSDPDELAGQLRRAVQAVDPNLPISQSGRMDEMFASSISQPRFAMLLLSLLGGLALVLAAVGIYGVMSYLAEQRRQEMGIRMALGAGRRDVFRLVLGEGIVLTALGLGLGLLGAVWLTRLLASQMFEISTRDPLTYATGFFLLLTVALLATVLPAHRATRVDPLQVLREE